MAKRKVVVAYDISDNKTRKRVRKILKDWRIGGQKSVHECLLSMNEAQELFIQLSAPLNHSTDSLMMAWIDSNRTVLCRCLAKTMINFNQFVS